MFSQTQICIVFFCTMEYPQLQTIGSTSQSGLNWDVWSGLRWCLDVERPLSIGLLRWPGGALADVHHR